jgi:hypothetical protein
VRADAPGGCTWIRIKGKVFFIYKRDLMHSSTYPSFGSILNPNLLAELAPYLLRRFSPRAEMAHKRRYG